ncbi:MAG: aromatic alcohol reductase [Myxococcaceae bacterium]|nr:aromatic alcohol reductase [Myxococcaceae bacterium]
MGTSNTQVLVAGATGMLGQKISHALLDKPGVEVRLLVRAGATEDPKKRQGLLSLQERGARIVEGDLGALSSLVEATRGVDVIVSAVNGDENTVVNGQLQLLEAAKRNGVRRFIPSDYSVDFFKLKPGDNAFLDYRIRVAEAVQKSGLEHTSVLNGAFTEVLLAPFFGAYDSQAGRLSFWGDGETEVDMSTTDDTARYTAEAALDPRAANTHFEVAGDVLTLRGVARVLEEATGRKVEAVSKGSVEELGRWISEKRTTATSVFEYVPAQYQWAMVSGKGKLRNLVNNRYPHIQPVTLRQFLHKHSRGAMG